MSDLQIWLLVLGAAAVVAMLAFNWNQERRFRKQADAAFQSPRDEAPSQRGADALRDSRREPALHEPSPGFESGAEVGLRSEPRLDIDEDAAAAPLAAERPAVVAVAASPAPVLREAPPAGPRAAPPRREVPPAPYDELIEYRVRIASDGVLANVFADAFNHARTLGKTIRWYGLPVGASQWEDVQPWRDVHYEQVTVTLQLADRNGAVQDEQLAALCSLLQTVAQTHGLQITCDDRGAALDRAQAIDRFCVDVDVLIGLNVVARSEGAVSLARIVRAAESGHMVLGVDGVYQLLDSRGEPLYALCNHDAEPFSTDVAEGDVSQGVTLQFDVPRVPDGLKVFDGMVAFGRKLANEVGGMLVDDNLRPLTDAGIEKIRVQLTQIYERMEARGVPSGSRRALRLFS